MKVDTAVRYCVITVSAVKTSSLQPADDRWVTDVDICTVQFYIPIILF